MKLAKKLREGITMRKNLTAEEKNKVKLYIDKLVSADKDNAIESIAIAEYSIGTEDLHLYVIFNKETEIPAAVDDIITVVGYTNLKKQPLGVSIGVEYDDEAMPEDIIFLYKRGDKR